MVGEMGLLAILKGEQPGLIESMRNYKDKGQYGEYLMEYALRSKSMEGNHVVLSNLYLPMKGKTTEIDLIMIHEKGIFVFESKNYKGSIYGNENQLKWTQCFNNGWEEYFYNPIKQNRTHIKALAEYLSMPEEAFSSYIVFSERCKTLFVPKPTAGDVTVLRRPAMLRSLKKKLKDKPVIYSCADIETIKQRLEPVTNVTQLERQKHIEDIKTKCPYCGSLLVLRSGKYGQFWGCSAYPRCHYTRKV